MTLESATLFMTKILALTTPLGASGLILLTMGGDGFWFLGDRPGWKGKFWVVIITLLVVTVGVWFAICLVYLFLTATILGVDLYHALIEIYRSL